MAATDAAPREFVVAARRLTGSDDEIRQQLDDMIASLIAFRNSFATSAVRAHRLKRRRPTRRRVNASTLAFAALPRARPDVSAGHADHHVLGAGHGKLPGARRSTRDIRHVLLEGPWCGRGGGAQLPHRHRPDRRRAADGQAAGRSGVRPAPAKPGSVLSERQGLLPRSPRCSADRQGSASASTTWASTRT